MTYEGMTKREAIAELREARDDVNELIGQLEDMRRLHEAATVRNVELLALIEDAREHLDTLGMTDAVALLDPVRSERAVREMRHRFLIRIAEEIEGPGRARSVGATWIRRRAIEELVNRDVDKWQANGRRSA